MTVQFFFKAKNFILLEQDKWRYPFLDHSKYQNWKFFFLRDIFQRAIHYFRVW